MVIAERNSGIDFTKGFLVIVMVAYHTLNYFLEGRPLIYAYLYYVTQAFVFFSGFLCGSIYLDKFKTNKKYVCNRLFVRGLKLIALFSIVNLGIHLFLKENYNGEPFGLDLFLKNFGSMLLRGGAMGMSMEILIPIAYVLLTSILLLHLTRYRYVLYISFVLLTIILSYFDIELPYNANCMLFGIGGFFTGLISMDAREYLNNKYIKFMGVLLLLIYFSVVIPLGIDVRYSLLGFFIYINVVVANLFLLGSYLSPSRIITRNIITFGQYSLYLYLAQIFFLQICHQIIRTESTSLGIEHGLIFVAINLLLVLSCYTADYLRSKNQLVDRLYHFVFS